MKKLILAAFVLTTAVGVFAQGTVTFQSYPIGTVRVWGPSTTDPGLSLTGNSPTDNPAGTTDYAARSMSPIGTSGVNTRYGSATTFAQLLWANGAGAAESSLTVGGQTTTFRTGTTVGRITQITDTITGLTKDGAAATFQVVAWDNFSGQYPTWSQASGAWLEGVIAAGKSTPFTLLAIGGDVNTPPNTVFTGFNLYTLGTIPEPSTFALAGLGAAALLIFRRRK